MNYVYKSKIQQITCAGELIGRHFRKQGHFRLTTEHEMMVREVKNRLSKVI